MYLKNIKKRGIKKTSPTALIVSSFIQFTDESHIADLQGNVHSESRLAFDLIPTPNVLG
jgi:hypothetical protein